MKTINPNHIVFAGIYAHIIEDEHEKKEIQKLKNKSIIHLLISEDREVEIIKSKHWNLDESDFYSLLSISIAKDDGSGFFRFHLPESEIFINEYQLIKNKYKIINGTDTHTKQKNNKKKKARWNNLQWLEELKKQINNYGKQKSIRAITEKIQFCRQKLDEEIIKTKPIITPQYESQKGLYGNKHSQVVLSNKRKTNLFLEQRSKFNRNPKLNYFSEKIAILEKTLEKIKNKI